MPRLELVTHNGKEIAIIDLSNSMPQEAIAFLAACQKELARRPPKSVLALTDATNAIFDKESARAMMEFVAKNTPLIKASAVLGADSLRLVLLNTITAETGRDIKAFQTREEALDWLAGRG